MNLTAHRHDEQAFSPLYTIYGIGSPMALVIYIGVVLILMSKHREVISYQKDTSCLPLVRLGPRLNMKTVFPRYGDSHVKDKTVGETVLSLTWESLYW